MLEMKDGPKPVRVLLVGCYGKQVMKMIRNLEACGCQVEEHWPEIKNVRTTIPPKVELVVIVTQFAAHNLVENVSKLAKESEVPFVRSTLDYARLKGHVERELPKVYAARGVLPPKPPGATVIGMRPTTADGGRPKATEAPAKDPYEESLQFNREDHPVVEKERYTLKQASELSGIKVTTIRDYLRRLKMKLSTRKGPTGHPRMVLTTDQIEQIEAAQRAANPANRERMLRVRALRGEPNRNRVGIKQIKKLGQSIQALLAASNLTSVTIDAEGIHAEMRVVTTRKEKL
jgi:hypothetical protein